MRRIKFFFTKGFTVCALLRIFRAHNDAMRRLIDSSRAIGELNAQVAELVDALVSGISDRKIVEVRVFSWAPISKKPDR